MAMKRGTYDWEWITRGIEKAVEMGWKKSAIGKVIGTSGSNLGNIIRRKSGDGQLVENLIQWLSKNVYASVNTKGSVDPLKILRQETRTLLDTLESPDFTVEYKMKKFGAFIAFFHAEIDSINVALKKAKE